MLTYGENPPAITPPPPPPGKSNKPKKVKIKKVKNKYINFVKVYIIFY